MSDQRILAMRIINGEHELITELADLLRPLPKPVLVLDPTRLASSMAEIDRQWSAMGVTGFGSEFHKKLRVKIKAAVT